MTALNASQSNQHTGYDETCGSSFKKGLFHVLGADKRREDVLYSNLRCTASLSRLTQGTNHGPNVHSTGKGTHLMFLFFFKWIKIKSFCLTPRVKKKISILFIPIFFAYCQIQQAKEAHLAFGGNTASITLIWECLGIYWILLPEYLTSTNRPINGKSIKSLDHNEGSGADPRNLQCRTWLFAYVCFCSQVREKKVNWWPACSGSRSSGDSLSDTSLQNLP